MRKRIDPIRHWSIVIFILLTLVVELVLLPLIARVGGWKLDAQNRSDRRFIIITLCVILMICLFTWIRVLNFVQDWRDKRTRPKRNPYDLP